MNDLLSAVVIMLAAVASTYETPLQKDAVETETDIELSGQKIEKRAAIYIVSTTIHLITPLSTQMTA